VALLDKKKDGFNHKIVGLPLNYTQNSDPSNRVFWDTIVNNANILNIIPGKPSYKKGSLRAEKFEAMKGLIVDNPDSNRDGLLTDTSTPSLNKDYYADEGETKSVSKERDLRYYSFEVDMYNYRRIANVLLNEVSGKLLGLGLGNSNIEKFVDVSKAHTEGLHFYCDSATSVSESASNSVGDSMLSSMAKGASDKAKELAFITGSAANKDSNASSGDENTDMSERTILESLGSGIQSLGSTVMSGINENMGSVVNGENIIYPKVWKDSSFSKSYNIAFKFVSPYGNPASIFEHVYAPFLMLLAMSLPIQTKPDSFKAPMLLRLDSPGFMSCDMGMVTSFTFIRGGSDGLWASNGLPLAIDVNMVVTDMYPTLAVASNMALLRQNIGLSAMLDNMAGLASMSANISDHLSGSIANKIALVQGFDDSIVSAARDTIDSTLTSIFGL